MPAELVLDTGLVFSALSSAEKDHLECAAFFERTADHGTSLVFSRLLEIELLDLAYKVPIREQFAGRKWERYRTDGRALRRGQRLANETMESWSELLAAHHHLCIGVGEVMDLVPGLMGSYGLRSNDAVHYGTALIADVADIATLDEDFARVPSDGLRLFAPSASVERCRKDRGGRFK